MVAETIPVKSVQTLVRAITRNALILLFLLVFFLSVLLGPDLSPATMFFGLIKALLAVALAWIFFLVINDAVVRTITASGIDSKASRREGGLLYHFLPPDPNELPPEETAAPAQKKKKK